MGLLYSLIVLHKFPIVNLSLLAADPHDLPPGPSPIGFLIQGFPYLFYLVFTML